MHRRRTLLLRCALAASLAWIPRSGAAETEADSSWQWFAVKPRVFKALRADPREAQVRVGYLYSTVGRSFFDLGFGGQLGIARWEENDRAIELAVRGLITSRFQFGSRSFDLQNSDIVGGIAASYRLATHSVELFLSHQSSHLGDDATLARRAINYSFESTRLLFSEDVTPLLRLYAGLDVKLRADPDRLRGRASLITGGDWHFLPPLPRLFAGLDVRFKGEHDYAPNVAAVIGYELGGDATAALRQRLFLEIFDGYSNLGQFDTQRELYAFLGIGFTL